MKLTRFNYSKPLLADGADIDLFEVEVIDKNGYRCPTALNMIDFTLTGEAEWRGGIAQGPDNHILAKSLPVEGGVNRVMIRSTGKAGLISLKATSGNLRPAEIQLNSSDIHEVFDSFRNTARGLSEYFPSDRLPSYLGRGPTPAGESFTPSRRSLAIASVTAGSDTEKTRNTFDDNELSDWSSDGKKENAWIRYDFAKPEPIDQVVLKMIGWRTLLYPLKISVDDKVVFMGTTSRSLGYVTINFPRTTGKSIKIELDGEAANRDALGNIIEITGTPDPNSQANRGGRTKLGIVEAEFYEVLNKK